MHTTLYVTLTQAATGPAATPPADTTPDTLMTWGIILFASAIVMLGVELLVPSGGLLSIAAATCAVAGIICLFFKDTTLGFLATLAVLIATPFIAGFMIKLWPHTPVGRWLTLGGNDDNDPEEDFDPQRPRDPAANSATTPAPLRVGDTGTAKTPLRPVGTCVIAGQRLECVAESSMIEPHTPVRVVDVEGTLIKVRALPTTNA